MKNDCDCSPNDLTGRKTAWLRRDVMNVTLLKSSGRVGAEVNQIQTPLSRQSRRCASTSHGKSCGSRSTPGTGGLSYGRALCPPYSS